MALLAMLYMTGCMVEEDDYYAKKTHPGYIVFEYSNDIIHQYIRRMDIINKFDIYYSQPTPAKKDSVDRLYFSEIKILNEANSDVWTINDLKYPGMYLKINTDGQSLSEQDAVWIVSESSNEINNSFPIKKEDGQYFIINHTGNIRDFLYFAEWKFYVNANRNEIELTGKCELLSVATPALKIDFEIIQPVLLGNYTLRNGIISGELKISAIDVDKDLKEETKAVYRQNNEVSITYMNNTELWSCIPYYYGYY
jgi:hypothetical protein